MTANCNINKLRISLLFIFAVNALLASPYLMVAGAASETQATLEAPQMKLPPRIEPIKKGAHIDGTLLRPTYSTSTNTDPVQQKSGLQSFNMGPIVPGSENFYEVQRNLADKMPTVLRRQEKAKVASQAGDHEGARDLLLANVAEFDYVDSFIDSVLQSTGGVNPTYTNAGNFAGFKSRTFFLKGHPEVQHYADALENYARFLLSQNRWEEAEKLIAKTCLMLEIGYGVNHQLTSSCQVTQASVLIHLGKMEDFNKLVERTQNKIIEHNKEETVLQMQSQLLNWIDTLPQMDTLAQQFVAAASDSERRSILRQAKRTGKKIIRKKFDRALVVNEYVKVMKNIIRKGTGYVGDQRERLERLVNSSSSSISQIKMKELVSRLAVVRSFHFSEGTGTGGGRLKDKMANQQIEGALYGRILLPEGGATVLGLLEPVLTRITFSNEAAKIGTILLLLIFSGVWFLNYRCSNEKTARQAQRRRLSKQYSATSAKQLRRRQKSNIIQHSNCNMLYSANCKSDASECKLRQKPSKIKYGGDSDSGRGSDDKKDIKLSTKHMQQRVRRQERRMQRRQLENERRKRLYSIEKEKRKQQAEALKAAKEEQRKVMESIAAREAVEMQTKEAELRRLREQAKASISTTLSTSQANAAKHQKQRNTRQSTGVSALKHKSAGSDLKAERHFLKNSPGKFACGFIRDSPDRAPIQGQNVHAKPYLPSAAPSCGNTRPGEAESHGKKTASNFTSNFANTITASSTWSNSARESQKGSSPQIISQNIRLSTNTRQVAETPGNAQHFAFEYPLNNYSGKTMNSCDDFADGSVRRPFGTTSEEDLQKSTSLNGLDDLFPMPSPDLRFLDEPLQTDTSSDLMLGVWSPPPSVQLDKVDAEMDVIYKLPEGSPTASAAARNFNQDLLDRAAQSLLHI